MRILFFSKIPIELMIEESLVAGLKKRKGQELCANVRLLTRLRPCVKCCCHTQVVCRAAPRRAATAASAAAASFLQPSRVGSTRCLAACQPTGAAAAEESRGVMHMWWLAQSRSGLSCSQSLTVPIPRAKISLLFCPPTPSSRQMPMLQD